MTEMFGEAWSPMSVPDLAPDDDDECLLQRQHSLSSFKDSIKRVSGGPENSPLAGRCKVFLFFC